MINFIEGNNIAGVAYGGVSTSAPSGALIFEYQGARKIGTSVYVFTQ